MRTAQSKPRADSGHRTVLGGVVLACAAAALAGMARWGLVEPTGMEALCDALRAGNPGTDTWHVLQCSLRPWVIESFQHHGWSRISGLSLAVALGCMGVNRVRPAPAWRLVGRLASGVAISAAAVGLMLYDTDISAVLLVTAWAVTWQMRVVAHD